MIRFLKFLLIRFFRLTAKLLLILAVYSLVKIPWVQYFRTDAAKLLANQEREDVLTRRAYLVSRYDQGSLDPSTMPFLIGEFFQGEWAIGSCSMMAAALTNIAFIYPETRADSLRVVRGLVDLMLRQSFRKFDTGAWGEDAIASLDGPNGHIGYLGHLNLVLAAHRILGGDDTYDDLHRQINQALARRVAQRPYLATYPQQWYSADTMVVYASLKLYADIFAVDFERLFDQFLSHTKGSLLDPNTGLVVFWLDAAGGPVGVSRGSGVGWNSFYLPFFAESFAAQQYAKAKEKLLVRWPLGIRGFREFAPGVPGMGDIDSGPVVLGMSTSGTAFFIAGARRAADVETLDGLLLLGEIAGSSIQWNGKRRYLLAPLVGDAIILAMKTSVPWDTRYVSQVV